MSAMCPYCNKPVDHLRVIASETVWYDVSLIEPGELHYTNVDNLSSDFKLGFQCPHCLETITRDEDAAKVFLCAEVEP